MAAGGDRRTGEIVLGLAIVGLGLFFLGGAFAVEGEAAYAGVGPRAFPILIGLGLTICGAVFTWRAAFARRPGPAAARDAAALPPGGSAAVNRAAILWIAGGLAVTIVAIQPLGFPPTAALLFAATSRAFGSRRPARDALLGLALGAVVFLVFARALGISLPGGPLDLMR